MTVIYDIAHPETSITPKSLTRVDATQESGNIVHTMLDGSIAVTLIGDLPAAGTFEIIFDDDAAATAARAMLATPAVFELTGSARAAFNMRFVRSGALGATVHDEARQVWVLTVGFQEVPA